MPGRRPPAGVARQEPGGGGAAHDRLGSPPARGLGSPGRLLFGITQGASDPDLRRRLIEEITALDFTATRSAGSPSASRVATDARRHRLGCAFEDKPRYFMGIGDAAGIPEVIERGIDMFDCVLPTRTARTGSPTWEGRLNLRNARCPRDPETARRRLPCPACARLSRAYIRHLVNQEVPARPPPVDFAQPLLRSRRHTKPGRRSKQVNWHP